MAEIRMQQHFSAAPETVFAAVTDHGRMGEWVSGAKVTVEKPGNPAPNGLGAVRRVVARGLSVWEEVVRWEAPRAMDYRVVRGGPMRNHLGEVRVEPAPGGGTDLEYRIRFEVPWYLGGGVLAGILGSVLKGEITKGLARLAEKLGRA